MGIRTIGIAAACLGLSFSSALAQEQGDEPATEASALEDWGVAVIELGYADAEELAAVLSQVLPPSVRVVPYYQTNSLIISGERAVIDELTRGGEDEDEDEDGENEASGPSEPVAEGELTAQL